MNSDIIIDIDEEYKIWSKDNRITKNQRRCIKNLWSLKTKQSKKIFPLKTFTNRIFFRSNGLDKYINNIFPDKKSLKDLDFDSFQELLKVLTKEIKIPQKVQKVLSSKYSIEEINNILNSYNNKLLTTNSPKGPTDNNNNTYKEYSEITIHDLKKLIKYDPINFHTMISFFKSDIPKIHSTVLEYSSKYEYGTQKSKYFVNDTMRYIKFYDLLVLDYDSISLDQVLEYLNPEVNNHRFRIYKTFNGYHVFVVSHKYLYSSNESATFANNLKCDPMYIVFSRYNGYIVRLTPKINRNEQITHTFVMEVGSGENVHTKLIDLFENKLTSHPLS
jgi:hypothetical protein